MSWDAVGAIGEIVGAAAVVVTVGYLAVQMRQNTASVRTSAFQVWAGSNVPAMIVQDRSMAESVSIGLANPEELKGPQWIQYGFFLHQLMYVAQTTFFLKENQSIPVDLYEAEMDRGAAILQMDSGKQWWEAGARTQFAQTFVDEIEKRAQRSLGYQIYGFTEGRGFHAME